MTLDEVLPDSDYRFSFRFERADPAAFFAPTECHADLIAQRRSWLEIAPERYAALLPDGAPLLDELIELAGQWGALESPGDSVEKLFTDPRSRCVALGCEMEPDFLLLKPDASGTACLVGGVVCFPSSWSLGEKIGRPITSIHEVVPGLNQALGSQISSFLLKLRPGVAWSRANWGLSRTPELNQHPSRGLPRLDENIGLDDAWLRVEHQVLVALPKTQGLLFGIRIVNHALGVIRANGSLAQRLARGLKTMPDTLAEYKGLGKARHRLIELLAVAT
jgi:hypothetical protein